VAFKQEIQLGKASIRSAVSGELRDYEIEIQELYLNEDDVNKGMIFQVTDPELLELTGGVIQGMSGSPIIQDGKLVGAVTHVLVNDPTRGYGIFIENMLTAAS
jgi:stage IV sporulation protein B